MKPSDLPKFNKLINKAAKYHEQSNWEMAAKLYLAAWDLDPDNTDVLVILSHLMVQLGVRDKAIALLEAALKHHGPIRDVLSVMGQMAHEMGMHETAEKVYYTFIQKHPTDAEAYNGYANALMDQKRFDEAISFLQNTIPSFTDNAALWNTLGAALNQSKRYEEALIFFEEALKLQPKNVQAYNNKSLALFNLGRMEEYEIIVEKGLKLDPNFDELRLGKSFIELSRGHLQKGFELYQSRHKKADTAIMFTIQRPKWKGEDLTGKTILIQSEQGIGDEILFLGTLPPAVKKAKKVIVGCDTRLKASFERSFPDYEFTPQITFSQAGFIYRAFPEIEKRENNRLDDIDYVVPAGDVASFYANTYDDFPIYENGYIQCDPEEKAKWKDYFDALSPNMKVGIVWTSSIVDSQRGLSYFSLESMLPILKTPNIDFISLQYTDCTEQREAFEEKHGIKIHKPEGINLKNELDRQFALMQNLDMFVGAGMSTTMFAAAAGVPTWWLCRGIAWWNYGKPSGLPIFPNTTYAGYSYETPDEKMLEDAAKRFHRYLETGNIMLGYTGTALD